MRICQDFPLDKGVDSVAVSIFLLTDVLVAFDSTDHIGVSFMLLSLVGRGLPRPH